MWLCKSVSYLSWKRLIFYPVLTNMKCKEYGCKGIQCLPTDITLTMVLKWESSLVCLALTRWLGRPFTEGLSHLLLVSLLRTKNIVCISSPREYSNVQCVITFRNLNVRITQMHMMNTMFRWLAINGICLRGNLFIKYFYCFSGSVWRNAVSEGLIHALLSF